MNGETNMNRAKILAGAFLLLFAAGCAGRQEQTFADQMRSTASQWDKGKAMIKSGEAQVKQGEQEQKDAEKLMATGKSNVEEGEGKIKDGKQLVEQIEREHPELNSTATP